MNILFIFPITRFDGTYSAGSLFLYNSYDFAANDTHVLVEISIIKVGVCLSIIIKLLYVYNLYSL